MTRHQKKDEFLMVLSNARPSVALGGENGRNVTGIRIYRLALQVAATLAVIGGALMPVVEAWLFSGKESLPPRQQPMIKTESPFIPGNFESQPVDRRRALVIASTSMSSCLIGLSTTTSPANARNLPTSNGADTSKLRTVDALVPIVQLRDRLRVLRQSLQEEHRDNQLNGSAPVSSKLPTREQDFKRLFDAYSEQVSYKQKFMDQNAFLVYYTQGYDGPGRKRMEEGDVENERQTLQFGARNEAWVAWESFLAEQEYYQKSSLKKDRSKEEEEEDFSEMMKYLSETIKAVDGYLNLAPQEDLATAERELSKNRS